MSIMSMTCNNPANPYDKTKTKINLYARSAAGAVSSTVIDDSVGNTIYIGCNSNLPSNIDSVQFVYTVKYSGSSKDSSWGIFKDISTKKSSDTLWDSLAFSDSGTKIIMGIAYINGTTISDSIIATIHLKPANHKPILNVTGDTSITVAQTCTLTAFVSDVDSLQTHSFSVLKKPLNGSFVNPVFTWKPSSDNIGKDTVVFMVSDNGYPVMSDTDTLVITVSDTGSKKNRAPQWEEDTINLSGSVGSKISLTLTEACSDSDGDALTYTLMPGTPAGDTITGGVWSFTPAAGDTGTYYAKIIAKDPLGLSDTVVLHITITATDLQAPVLRFLSPSKDTVIGADSCNLTVVCKDASGIASLKCSVDTVSFTTTKSTTADSIYTAKVKGLKAGQNNTVKFTATDASTNANKDSITVNIKYDNDTTKPVVTRVTPSQDTISTNASSYTITLKCTDASGIASVIGVKGSIIDTGTAGTDSTYTITVNALTQGIFDTVNITVTDKSLRANKTTIAVKIKYDPTLADKTGPTITKVSGPADTVSAASFTLVDSIFDPSGVDSVYGKLNSGTKTAITASGSRYTFTGTLSEGADTITITAKDKSTAGNWSTQTIIEYYIKAPTITTQPTAQTACPGNAVTLNIAASGTLPLIYKWYKGTSSVGITDSTSGSFKINALTLTDTGYYKVTVSNWAGSVMSDSVKISVTKYTVTFNSDSGSSVSSQTIICDSLATKPTDPTRTGYQFSGWYLNSTYTTAFSFSTNITSALTLYAKWLKLHTVTYNGNYYTGGTLPTDTTKYVSGSWVTVMSNGNLAKTHYTFKNWNKIFGGTGKAYSGSGKDTFQINDEDVTLYAQWTIDSFTVYFDNQGAETAGSFTSKKCPYGLISFPTAPSKTSCTFAGWWTNTAGRGDSVKATDSVKTNDTVYALWTVKDVDGNVYKTVYIGTQTWMAENLRTTKYRTGTTVSGYLWYNGDSNSYRTSYGALYNEGSVMNILAPTGWHIPTYNEWLALMAFVGDSAGGKLKETGTTFWTTPNTGATNKYGFTALPGGFYTLYRSANQYYNIKQQGWWWGLDSNTLSNISIYYDSYGVDSSSNTLSGAYYFSVRCIRNK
jgi:uncharacterized protein (TIGR02145 family)/uncharacterized repeat protein (TIGR02543 family)